MTFQDITEQLLSKKDCALLIGGAFFVQSLHKSVRVDIGIVRTIKNPAKNERALLLKQRLEYILNNYESARRMPVGSLPPRK